MFIVKKETIRYNDSEWYTGLDLVVNYTLIDGVLTVIHEGSYMHHNPAKDAEAVYWDFKGVPYTWSHYESPFVDLDFHTAVLEPGFTDIKADFFTGCKNLKKVVIPDTALEIHPDFARGVNLEYQNDKGLLFMGNAKNPHHFLMGCDDEFREGHLIIPEGVNCVHAGAFDGKDFIKELSLPQTLKGLGKYSFRGTSIKSLFIPDKGLGEDETASRWYFGVFVGCPLENISVPYNHYEFYLENTDMEHVDWWHAFPNCTIGFRQSEGGYAEVLPPDEDPKFNEPQPLDIHINGNSDHPQDSDSSEDELPF